MTIIKTKTGEVKLPCMEPILVPIDKVHTNNFYENPNHVSRNNMELLKHSILFNGFCFPVVCVNSEDYPGEYEIVDGHHRFLLFRDYLQAEEIPIVINARSKASDRMCATVEFNRARGVHGVEEMSELVRKMLSQGMTDEEVAKENGMELEEVLRLKQLTGIADVFKNQDYSRSWSMEEVI